MVFLSDDLAVSCHAPALPACRQQKDSSLPGWERVLSPICDPPLAKVFGLPWGGFEQPMASGYFVMYAVIGYLLSTADLGKRERWGIYLFGAVCLVLRYGYTLYFSSLTGEVCRTLFDYGYFTAVLPAASVFLWVRNHNWRRIEDSPRAVGALAKVSGCSFGVYLVHMIVLNRVVFGFFSVPVTSVMLRTVCPFLIYAGCLGVVFLIKKIPVVRNVVP